jgi:hypothetical protein
LTGNFLFFGGMESSTRNLESDADNFPRFVSLLGLIRMYTF